MSTTDDAAPGRAGGVALELDPGTAAVVRRAAADLEAYARQLFGPGPAATLVLGTVAERHVARALGRPVRLSDQGFALRRTAPDTLVLAGGSAPAAAWAAYELAERWGVRYLLHGDVVPARPEAPPAPDLDEVHEPRLRLRSWRQFNDLPTGPALWTLDQQRAFLRQVFKLKYNGVYLSLWPQQPFLALAVGGIRQQTGTLLFGQRIPIDAETPSRQHLPAGMAVLDHPDLFACRTFAERHRAGGRLLAGILDEARSYGMHTAIHIQPLEFPAEFAPLLQEPTGGIQLGSLTTAERGDLTGAGHLALVRATLEAWLEQWGDRIDELSLHLPEHPHAEARFEACWGDLDARYGLEAAAPLSSLRAQAEGNDLIPGGRARAVREFRSGIAMLHFFDRFFAGNDLLARARARRVDLHLGLGGNCEPLFPVLERVLWPGAGINTSLGYTASRAVRAMACMERLDASRVPATLILTFQDDNVGWLPQVASGSHDLLLAEARRLGWRGFCTRHWPIGDLDAAATFAARAAWDEAATPAAVWEDHGRRVFGPEVAADVARVFRLLQEATVILDLDYLSLFFPVLGILRPTLSAEAPMPEGLFHLRAQYAEAARILARLEPRVTAAAGRRELAYWQGRLTFAIEALREKELLHEGGMRRAAAKAAPAGQAAGLRAQADALYGQAVAAGQRALAAAAAHVRDEADATSAVAYYHFFVREVRDEARRLAAADRAG